VQQKSGYDLFPFPKFNTFYDDSDEIMHTQPPPWFSGNDNSFSTFSPDSCNMITEKNILHLFRKNDVLQESEVQPESTTDVSVPPPVSQEEILEMRSCSSIKQKQLKVQEVMNTRCH